MTQEDIDNGRLLCQVGIAPIKPAEFVVKGIGLWTANKHPKDREATGWGWIAIGDGGAF